MSWKQRFKLNCSSSLKKKCCINCLNIHGTARVVKRLLWLSVILGATIGCLITISDRIRYLISSPTATTISAVRHHTLTFPAVTLCNPGNFRIDILEERNLTSLIQFATLLVSDEGAETIDNREGGSGSGSLSIISAETCEQILESVSESSINLGSITFEEFAVQTRQPVDDFIQGCYFAGEPCGNITEIFEPIFTNLGICYTFNSGKARPLLQSKGTGQRQGLQLVVNSNQPNSIPVLDIGLMVALNTQSELPLPANQGIGVPVGRNAFISIKERNIRDQTRRNCSSDKDVATFNFLQGDYSSYSESACLMDCVHSRIADNCECIGARSFYPPNTDRYSQLPNCTLEKICCVVDTLPSLLNDCNCRSACSSTLYEAMVSYNSLPAEELQSLASRLGLPTSLFPSGFLTVSVYFETLSVETQLTSSVYSFVALLSDIGGQVGLFLGLSVISVLQFGDWIIKMLKSRDLHADLKKIKNTCTSCCQKHSVALDKRSKSQAVESKTSTAIDSQSTQLVQICEDHC